VTPLHWLIVQECVNTLVMHTIVSTHACSMKHHWDTHTNLALVLPCSLSSDDNSLANITYPFLRCWVHGWVIISSRTACELYISIKPLFQADVAILREVGGQGGAISHFRPRLLTFPMEYLSQADLQTGGKITQLLKQKLNGIPFLSYMCKYGHAWANTLDVCVIFYFESLYSLLHRMKAQKWQKHCRQRTYPENSKQGFWSPAVRLASNPAIPAFPSFYVLSEKRIRMAGLEAIVRL
jgi:hypothetical protein